MNVLITFLGTPNKAKNAATLLKVITISQITGVVMEQMHITKVAGAVTQDHQPNGLMSTVMERQI